MLYSVRMCHVQKQTAATGRCAKGRESEPQGDKHVEAAAWSTKHGTRSRVSLLVMACPHEGQHVASRASRQQDKSSTAHSCKCRNAKLLH